MNEKERASELAIAMVDQCGEGDDFNIAFAAATLVTLSFAMGYCLNNTEAGLTKENLLAAVDKYAAHLKTEAEANFDRMVETQKQLGIAG